MESLDNNQKRMALITCFSTFILGYLNAHSIVYSNGSLISPQTGNLITLGIKISMGKITELTNNFMLFIGFGIGCLVSIGIVKLVKNKRTEFFISWSIFSMSIWLNLLFMNSLSSYVRIFILSFLSGIGISFFRKIGTLDLNSCIMTGNLKNMYTALCESTFLKENKKIRVCLTYAGIILLFFLGAFVLGSMNGLGERLTLLIISIISIIPFFVGMNITNVRKQW